MYRPFLKEILGLPHLKGISMIAYLDDLLIWSPSEEICRTQIVLQSLTSFRFLIYQDKSRVILNQNFVFLGINWFLTVHTWGITVDLWFKKSDRDALLSFSFRSSVAQDSVGHFRKGLGSSVRG
jgi:hypothetical protein